jgi:hypothetical protein
VGKARNARKEAKARRAKKCMKWGHLNLGFLSPQRVVILVGEGISS